MILVQIVPRLPPETDGVGDYALSLARQLRDNFGIESHFVVGDPTWSEGRDVEGFSASRLTDRSAKSLLSDLSSPKLPLTVLLHYVGYGYAKRGAPVWLINELERWRTKNEGSRLLTMFHEVYASGPFWTSSFWLSSLQKNLAARLARLSDSCLTSRQGYAEILKGMSRDKHPSIPTLPVFSNIGEPERPPLPLKDRKCRLVIFGGHSNRARVYENSLAALETACRALAIEEIFDVGPPTDSIVSQVNGIPLIQTGKRSAAEISAILSNSIAGFFDYNTALLAKSTIFAAYCAHRVIPIGAPYEDVKADGLEAGKHYWIASRDEKPLNLADAQKIADNAYEWYQTHNLSEQAKVFAKKIEQITNAISQEKTVQLTASV